MILTSPRALARGALTCSSWGGVLKKNGTNTSAATAIAALMCRSGVVGRRMLSRALRTFKVAVRKQRRTLSNTAGSHRSNLAHGSNVGAAERAARMHQPNSWRRRTMQRNAAARLVT